MKTEPIIADLVTVPDRLRQIDPARVDALAESMAQIGLIQPITVYTSDGKTACLVAGHHRLQAARQLGWEEIDAFFTDADDIDRELTEIDENLCRSELTPAEEAGHVARRKELWEARQNSGTTCSENRDRGRPEGFAAETAKATGKSKQDINRKAERGSKIAPDLLKELTGTKWDKGVHLDILKKLSHAEQWQAWSRVQDGASPDFGDAYSFIKGFIPRKQNPSKKPADPISDDETMDRWLATGMAWWNKGSAEWRQEFLSRVDEPIMDARYGTQAAE